MNPRVKLRVPVMAFSPSFLEFCAKVRKNDSSVLPELGEPLRIRRLSESESIELADALLKNNSVTYLKLDTEKFTKRSVVVMAKYARASKRLQHIYWNVGRYAESQQHEEMLHCLLPAIQDSTSIKELRMDLPHICGPSNLALIRLVGHGSLATAVSRSDNSNAHASVDIATYL
jgi:hypothetical protein